jgi:hypothetical protein
MEPHACAFRPLILGASGAGTVGSLGLGAFGEETGLGWPYGLRVSARLLRKNYNKGEKISHIEMGKLMITAHKTLLSWNYTLAPSKM